MNRESPTSLKHRATGKIVPARLVEGLTVRDVELVEKSWKPAIEAKLTWLHKHKISEQDFPQHLHWNWRNKYKRTGYLNYKWVGLKCNGDWQGLLVMELAQHFCQIDKQKGKPLVYLQYLATAPWNSPDIVDEPTYSLVGKTFMAVAIQESFSQAFKGRIGLHALPQSESYYADVCNMTDLGKDQSAENLRYFEMTERQARIFLTRKRTSK